MQKLTVGLIAWVVIVCAWEIWTNKWKGLFLCAILVIAGILMALGDHYDFNGNFAAIGFVVLNAIGFYSFKHYQRARSRSKPFGEKG